MKKLWLLLILLSLVTGCFSQHKVDLTTTPPSVVFPGQVSWNFIHAFMFKEDTTITPNCDGTGLYVKILGKFVTGFGLVENDGFTIAGDSITIITPGDYYLIYSYTFSGSNNADWKIAVFKNSVKQYGTRRSSTSGNYSGGTTPFYLLNLVAGDDISMKVANLTAPGTDNPTFSNVNLFIYKIPE
jgi:hypothetical protein